VIPKVEVLSIADESGLLHTTVEKDYVLGWVLFGFARHDGLNEWAFKGGTCLKKCFFDTYRFSEDLDFTVPDAGLYGNAEIQNALTEVAEWVEGEAGIEFPEGGLTIEELTNKRRLQTFQAKLTYAGPLGLAKRNLQRIKFDITQDEIVVDPTVRRVVYHQYSDLPTPVHETTCYSLAEVFAEKTRALYERKGRARDVYDVVNIGRNFRDIIPADRAREILLEKFSFKELPTPTTASIFARIDIDTLSVDWENALRHQLPVLPPVQEFYEALKESLDWWIEEAPPAVDLSEIPGAEETQRVPRVMFARAPELGSLGSGAAALEWAQEAPTFSNAMESIRFAARNRLLANVAYHGVDRLVEPYSLRRPSTGNLLLYVYEVRRGGVPSGGIKAFKVSEIESAAATNQPFAARFMVEL